MKGQAKALIPALIGITPLLLAGITGYVNSSGGQQTTDIAAIDATTSVSGSRAKLANALHAGAEAAAQELSDNVAADLAIQLTRAPTPLIALSDTDANGSG